MKKYQTDLTVRQIRKLSPTVVLLRLQSPVPLDEVQPGQFAQVLVEDSPKTFLRRPISIHFADAKTGELWLLVNQVGEGTRHLARLKENDHLNLVFPLGSGFRLPEKESGRVLLLGGGVGVAPLLLLGSVLKEKGYKVRYVLGAKKASDIVQKEEFERYGEVCVATEDGSMGHKGFVTTHPVLEECDDVCQVYTCGPLPMMKAVARFASQKGLELQVSLENKMACGLGACLCCVENTVRGHECVCTEGPVFDVKDLLWQI